MEDSKSALSSVEACIGTLSNRRHSNHGYHCCVPLCLNRSVLDASLSFHRFSNDRSRADLRRVWVQAIRREEGIKLPGNF